MAEDVAAVWSEFESEVRRDGYFCRANQLTDVMERLKAALENAHVLPVTTGVVWPQGARSGARVVVDGDRTVMYRPDGSIAYDSGGAS